MNFNEFVNQVQEDLTKYLPEKYQNIETSVRPFEKMNASYTGLFINNYEKVCPVVNLDVHFQDYYFCSSYENVMLNLADSIIQALEHAPKEKHLDPANWMHNLQIGLVSTERNKELLKDMPHKEIGDISLVYYIDVLSDEEGKGTIMIKNHIMQEMGLDEEQLHQAAIQLSVVNEPCKILNLESFPEICLERMAEIYVVTNQSGIFGASALFYPGTMERCAEALNGDYFVLPSSRHEMLLLADDGTHDYMYLQVMVKEINSTVVASIDFLSDTVYHYDHKERVFEMAEKYEERKRNRSSVIDHLIGKKQELMDKNHFARNQETGIRHRQGMSL